MRVVLQRVTRASVTIEDVVHGEIEQGFMLLVAAKDSDTQADVDYLAKKISKLRIFTDNDGKMNLAIKDVDGAILSISQFTLYAETRKGNRPGFSLAGEPAHAKLMYEALNEALEKTGLTVETGVFGADMQVALVNDGPVTIIYDTEAK